MLVLQREQVQDSVVCWGAEGLEPLNQPHNYAYQGSMTQQYLCMNCGRVVLKSRLRAEGGG